MSLLETLKDIYQLSYKTFGNVTLLPKILVIIFSHSHMLVL